ncbi:MAG: phosphotransacetylase family protein [Desulfotomaculaceae bacterium]|nr:phosphotransacetylase family protein [Desulfotomaculaceae bacterium]
MKSLYIMGTSGSGKTSVAVGLALRYRQEGYRVAYFKPVGSSTGSAARGDEDAVLMKELLQMEHPIETIVPYLAGPSYLSGYKHSCVSVQTIKQAYETVADGTDLVIIGGASFPHIMGCLGLDAASLTKEFQAAPLFTIRIESDYSLDMAIFFNSYLECKGISTLGNIFHNVPESLIAKTEGIYQPILEEHGYHILGVIPKHPITTSPTVKEYYEVLGGEILAGKENLDRVVEDVVIGAMTIESALGYLRRTANKAVITGGDRPEIALSALETSTSAIFLTGGFYPNVKLIARAEEKGIPIILVHQDTYTTIEKMSEVTRQIRANDQQAIDIAVENIDAYCNWRGILKALQ